mgnify:CR=1 FL=1
MNKKIEHIVLKYLNKIYGDIKPFTTKDFEDTIFFMIDNKIYVEVYNKKIMVNFDTIWRDLVYVFSLDRNDINYVILKWMKKTHKIENLLLSSKSYENNSLLLEFNVESNYNNSHNLINLNELHP